MRRLVFCIFIFKLSVVYAESFTPLPDTLSLQQAMEMANDNQYYQLIEAEASMADAQSQVSLAESSLGFKAQIEIEAAYIEPSRIALDQSSNDSSISLRLTKPIYDFGGSDEKILAANIEQAALQDYMQSIISQRKLDIARQFFEVLLSDLKYAWDNEALAIAFVRFDADKDRHALSQFSDIDLLESENRYLDTLHTRNLSEASQRHSRALLAEAINRPDQLPSNLSIPDVAAAQIKLPDFQLMLDKVLQNNPQIKLAEKQLEAARQRVEAEDRGVFPRLDAEVEISEHARTAGSNDEWRAQLNLVIPLYENTSIKSEIARARAEWLKQRSVVLNIKMQVRKQVLELWQNISVLNKRRQQLQTSQAFRELNLDRSRALYEMEVKTDLGNSMVAISEIQYRLAKNDFELALAMMQLRVMSGEQDILPAPLTNVAE